jgi:prolyl-tRNA editing enzyme YbaK/EbsC (Cys-tRNA(Pro) deacylase)
MSPTLPAIDEFLQQSGLAFEIWPCDPELADTARFCEHYGVALENSANAILVGSKTGERKYVLCVLLATHRLNTNHTVRKKMGARKVSFASADETRELTGMEIGGVTPLCLPAGFIGTKPGLLAARCPVPTVWGDALQPMNYRVHRK